MKFFKPNRRSSTMRERRLDHRKPSVLHAAICWEKNNSQRCLVTSVSLTGLFLELQECHPSSGAIMQLLFYCTIDGSRKLCSEWVRVEGHRDNGVAVSFTRFDNQHQCNMQLMLEQAVVHPAALATSKGAPASAVPPAMTNTA